MNFLNTSQPNESESYQTEDVYLTIFELNASVFTSNIILTLIFIFALIFNIISIVFIILARAFTTINLFIINLALADITYSLGIPFFITQSLNIGWKFGELGCRIFIFTEFSGIIVGIFTVAALSVERFMDVADKKNCFEMSTSRFKPCSAIMYSIFVWIFSLVFSLPIIFSIRLVRRESVLNCESDWRDSSLKMFFMLKLFLIFILPYTIIIISSIKLLKFLNDWKKRFVNSAFSSRRVNIETMRPRSRQNSQVQSSVVLIGCKYASIVQKNTQHLNLKRINNEYFNSNRDVQISNENCSKGSKIETNESSYQAYLNLNLNNENDNKDDLSKNGTQIFGCLCNMRKNFGRRRPETKSLIQNKYLNSIRRKAVRLVLVIILLFVIQWSPFWIFQFFMLFSTSNIKHIRSINMIVSTLSYSNTVANPALYMLLTYNFKEYLQKAVRSVPFLKCLYKKW